MTYFLETKDGMDCINAAHVVRLHKSSGFWVAHLVDGHMVEITEDGYKHLFEEHENPSRLIANALWEIAEHQQKQKAVKK